MNFKLKNIKLNLMILKRIFAFSVFILFGYSCAGSNESVSKGSASMENRLNSSSIIKINVQAQYSLKDSVYLANGDMIKQLTIQDVNDDDTRSRNEGTAGVVYRKSFNFLKDHGVWNIELIDNRGLMRDTLVTFNEPGEYTVRLSIKLDNATPFEISQYLNDFGNGGRVIIDKISN